MHHCNIAEQHTVRFSKVSQHPLVTFPSSVRKVLVLTSRDFSRPDGYHELLGPTQVLFKKVSWQKHQGEEIGEVLPSNMEKHEVFLGGIFSEIMYTQHDSSNKFRVCVALGRSSTLRLF